MKTLLSINNYHYTRGGAEWVFLAHNEMFTEENWNVVPFSMQHEKNVATEWSSYFVEEIELDGEYGQIERLKKSLKAIYSWEAKGKIEQLIDEVSPSVAHAHNIYHHISPSILSSIRKKGVPVVLTTHDLKIACPAYRMMNHHGICERCKTRRYFNATLNRCMHGSLALSLWVSIEAYLHAVLGSYRKYVNKFVVPSRFYIQKFAEWGFPEDDLVYIPNFVDASEIEPGNGSRKGFVYFGRLSDEKGVDTLIRASARSGHEVKILGVGPDEQRLRSLAAELQAPVSFEGFIGGDALFDYLRSAVAVILPSQWYENAPISVLEAFATGTPVIGADIGGIPELINSDRGRIFESASVVGLADAMDDLADSSSDELRRMGIAARDYVEAGHSRRKYVESCRNLYEEILESD